MIRGPRRLPAFTEHNVIEIHNVEAQFGTAFLFVVESYSMHEYTALSVS